MNTPTAQEIANVNAETMRHILSVRAMLLGCVRELCDRADGHDASKLTPPEDAAYAVLTPRLAGLVYGSEEYKASLREMKPAIAHHYANNSHHPEHYVDGIAGMNLFDLLEMLCDWKAATLRHHTSSMAGSLRINAERFQMPEPIRRLLENTLDKIEAIGIAANVATSYPQHQEAK